MPVPADTIYQLTENIMPNNYPDVPRIMAVTISTGRIGYAVLEGPSFLVDAETLDMRGADDDERIEKICAALAWNLPDTVIVEDIKDKGCMKGVRTRLLVKRFMKEAKRRRISVQPVSRIEVRNFFTPLGAHNKDMIARLVASHYPELIQLLPSKRETWDGEKYSMATFEAVSSALVYLKRLG